MGIFWSSIMPILDWSSTMPTPQDEVNDTVQSCTPRLHFADGRSLDDFGANEPLPSVENLRQQVAQKLQVPPRLVELVQGSERLNDGETSNSVYNPCADVLVVVRPPNPPVNTQLLPKSHPLCKKAESVAMACRACNDRDELLRCPDGWDLHTWLAVMTLQCCQEAAEMVSMITWTPEAATSDCYDFPICTCCSMRVGKFPRYKWVGDATSPPEDLPAPEHMQKIIEFASETLSDPEVVPPDGAALPESSIPRLQKLLSRVFRIYAHIYLHHYSAVQSVHAEDDLKTRLRTYLVFVRLYDLVPRVDFSPLSALTQKFLRGSIAEQTERQRERAA